MLAVRPNQRPQSGEQLRAVSSTASAEIPPRGRPGIDRCPAPSRHRPPAAQIEQVADATRINTAYLPTHMPTAARRAGIGPARTPTTFSPTAPMPTARATPVPGSGQSPPARASKRRAPPPRQRRRNVPRLRALRRTQRCRQARASAVRERRAHRRGAAGPSVPGALATSAIQKPAQGRAAPARPAPFAPSRARRRWLLAARPHSRPARRERSCLAADPAGRRSGREGARRAFEDRCLGPLAAGGVVLAAAAAAALQFSSGATSAPRAAGAASARRRASSPRLAPADDGAAVRSGSSRPPIGCCSGGRCKLSTGGALPPPPPLTATRRERRSAPDRDSRAQHDVRRAERGGERAVHASSGQAGADEGIDDPADEPRAPSNGTDVAGRRSVRLHNHSGAADASARVRPRSTAARPVRMRRVRRPAEGEPQTAAEGVPQPGDSLRNVCLDERCEEAALQESRRRASLDPSTRASASATNRG